MMDWNSFREHFPATKNGAYLNSAAVGPLPSVVFESYERHNKMMLEHGDWNWRETIKRRDEFREELALDLKTKPTQLAFGANTSHNMNMLAMFHQGEGNGKIVCSKEEFPSTYLPWLYHGFEIIFIKEAPKVEDYLVAVSEHNPVAVLCSAVQFATGYRIELKTLAYKLKEMGTPFVVNATQSLGVFPFDFESVPCDVMVASVHKWMCAGYGLSIMAFNPNQEFKKKLPLGGWLSVNHDQIMQRPSKDAPIEFRNEVTALETGVPAFSVIEGTWAAWNFLKNVGFENLSQRACELSSQFVKLAEENGFMVLSTRDDLSWEKSINSGTVLLDLSGGEELEVELQKHNVFVSARGKGIRIAYHAFNDESDFQKFFEKMRWINSGE